MKRFKKALAVVLSVILAAGAASGCSSGNTPAAPGPAAGPVSPPAAPQASGTQGKIIMRVGHGSAAGSARDLACLEMKKVIEAETGGQVEVQVYPASSLGSVMELIQGLQMNTIECTVQPVSQLGGFQPLCTIMDVPYLLPSNYEDLDKVLTGPAGRALGEISEEVGVKILGLWFTGYKAFTANSPLNVPSDLKGLKCRAMSSAILMAQYEVVGATPVYIDFAETYNALSTGAIDGQDNPLDTTTDMNFHEVQKYCTISNHGVLEQAVMINKQWYDSLSPEIQKAVEKGVQSGTKVCYESTLNAVDKAYQKMVDQGVVIKELSAEELAVWKQAYAPVKEVYLKANGDRGKELLDLFESEIAKLG